MMSEDLFLNRSVEEIEELKQSVEYTQLWP